MPSAISGIVADKLRFGFCPPLPVPYAITVGKDSLATRPIGMNQVVVEVPAIGDPAVQRGRIPDPKIPGPASSR